MKRVPSISVITATRNAAGLLPRLAESLRAQTFTDFEWVVADGCSTDSTIEVMERERDSMPGLRFFSQPDFGLYDALNNAIRRCQAPFYVVAGADDEFDPTGLATYARAAAEGSPDVVLARVRRADRIIGGFRPQLGYLGHPRVFRGSHSVGMLFRRSLHDQFGYYSARFPVLADGYFLKLMLRSGVVRFRDIPEVVGTFAEGGLSTTRKLQILCETWQIQMLTERAPALQTLLFLGKLAVRFPSIAAEMSKAKREDSRTAG